MGVIPLMAPGALDDGRPRLLDALLGDRLLDFTIDDDLAITGTPRSLLPGPVERLQAAMKPRDHEALADLAAAHESASATSRSAPGPPSSTARRPSRSVTRSPSASSCSSASACARRPRAACPRPPAAQADVDAAARGPQWQRMMQKERWLDAWLEVQRYIRLT